MIYSLYAFVHEQRLQRDNLGLLDHKEIERLYRTKYITNVVEDLSWVFLALAILLTTSIGFLVHQLVKGKKGVSDLPEVFESEAKNLTCILVFFCSTYFLRFVSDYIFVPELGDPS